MQPDSDFWTQLISFLGGLKGASVLAVVYGLVQVAMTFFNTSLGSVAGIWKLAVVSFLTIVGTILGQVMSGVPFLQALLNGSVLTAVSVFINEVIKHFKESPKVR